MRRGLWLMCLLVVGCKGLTREPYAAPPEVIPPPSNGIVIDDRRPAWEKRPFTGPVCLFHLGKVNPNPWEQLAKETEAVVAAMPQKPESVTVTVTAFRLVKKDETAPASKPAPVDPVGLNVGRLNSAAPQQSNAQSSLDYQSLVNAQRTGDGTRVQQVQESMIGKGTPGSVTGPPVGFLVGTPGAVPDPTAGENDFFLHYPAGACCEVHAVIKLTFPGGQEQTRYVKGIGSTPNTSGSAYWGEALALAVRMAVVQYGQQFRQGVGVPTNG